MADYHRRGLLFLADPTKALQEFKQELRSDILGADYKQEIETGIIQFVDDVTSKKIELRAHPTKRLHAKLYIFRPKGFNEHKPGAVITGSSNLTGAGIGVDENSRNYEFNVLLHDFPDVCYATEEFERLWKESVEILPKFLAEVRDSTYLAAAVSPYELYLKLLLEYFGQSIEYDPNAITDMPQGFKRLPLHADHHAHVNAALASFKESVASDTLQAQIVDGAQGPNERKALQYLDGFVNLPFINEEERLLIRAAQAAIRRARFQNLQRQVNQLHRSTTEVKLTPAALADKLMQTLRTYPLDTPSAEKPGSPVQLRPLDTPPEIILSESFSNGIKDSPKPLP